VNPYSAPGPEGQYGSVDPGHEKNTRRLRTLGIVQLVFAGLGVLSLINSLLPNNKDPIARRLNEVMWSGELGTWMRVSTGIGFVFTVVLALAGWCLLKRNPLGRTLTLAHGIGALGFGVVSFFVTRSLMSTMIATVASDLGPAGQIFKTTFEIALIFGFLFGSAVQLLELWLITRPGVKEFLQQGPTADPA
jgi:hypothetical protein